MADVNRGNRPLSPHLQIYKLPLAAKLSIFHRITGAALAGAGLIVAAWFVSGAFFPSLFACLDWLLASWVGRAISILAVWALFYHFCTGIRHLVWDLGRGLSIEQANRSNLFVIFGSLVLTALAILAIAL